MANELAGKVDMGALITAHKRQRDRALDELAVAEARLAYLLLANDALTQEVEKLKVATVPTQEPGEKE